MTMEQKTFSIASELKEGYFFRRVCGEQGKIDFELAAVGGQWPQRLLLQLDAAYTVIDFTIGHLEIGQIEDYNMLASGWFNPPPVEETLKGSFEVSGRTAALKLPGKTLAFTFGKPFSPVCCLCVGLEGNGSFRTLEVSGLVQEPAAAADTAMPAIDIAVDFNDSLLPAAWTTRMLKDHFQMFKDRGIRRIYWIYHGNPTDGVWHNNRWPWKKNILQTLENFGCSFVEQAVKAAHEAGLELVAVYKPFEGAWVSYEAPEYIREGKFPMLGSRIVAGFDFVVEHLDSCFRHAPIQPAGTPRFLEISHQGKTLKQKPELKLYTSPDNWHYTLCPDAAAEQIAENRWRFDLKEYPALFYAVSNSGEMLTNAAKDIMHLYDECGREVPSTLGSMPRHCRQAGKNHLEAQKVSQMDFREYGFMMDYSLNPSYVAVGKQLRPVMLGGDIPAMAIAQGVNPQVTGVLYPGDPATGEYWRKMVGQLLDAGVDGVALRVNHHSSITDWEQFGFNDAASSAADPVARRRARGDAYTARLREIAAQVRNQGKKIHLYISDICLGSPEDSTMMDVEWQWQRWIEEKLADEIVFKLDCPRSAFTGWGHEVLALCRKYALPVAAETAWQLLNPPRDYIRELGRLGFTSFTVYEDASIWSAKSDGEIVCFSDNINEILKQPAKLGKAKNVS